MDCVHRPLEFLFRRHVIFSALVVVIGVGTNALAAPLVPGAGEKIENVGDDFEDEAWAYTMNSPKSSHNLDNNIRVPGGFANNRRWAESAKRGQPDIVRRVETPAGGIEGSLGSMLLASRQTGVPGRPSFEMQQDDFLVSLKENIGGFLPVNRSPSCVAHVYLPPFDQWENRTGTSLGFRADCRGTKDGRTMEPYWPGFFISFQSETDPRYKVDSAVLLMRAGPRGYEFRGPEIKEPGWWTLGMSFTPDGQVHYYAHAGVEPLSEVDYLGSRFPYGFRCRELHTFFFNVASMDNGKTWSTPWIIDDVSVHYVHPSSEQTAGAGSSRRR